VVADKDGIGGKEVDSVPMVMVLVTEFSVGREEGMGILEVAEGTGELNEPCMLLILRGEED